MAIPGVGIVSKTPALDMAELTRVAAAIAHQVVHDVGPAWNLTAAVSAFETLGDVPDDYAQLLVMKTLSSAFFGLHKTRNGKFIAFVRHTPNSLRWAIFASHEVIEMLVNPDGQRAALGPSPAAAGVSVDYVVEPCDPVQDPEFAYIGITGVPVSNFCTPSYFDGTVGPLTFQPALAGGPLSIGEGGYVTWRDLATGVFSMTEVSAGAMSTRALGTANPIHGSLRAALDRIRPSSERLCSAAGKARLRRLRQELRAIRARRNRSGRRLNAELKAILRGYRDR